MNDWNSPNWTTGAAAGPPGSSTPGTRRPSSPTSASSPTFPQLATHDEVVAAIIRKAKDRGVLVHYCGRSQLCTGDRGLPDLYCVGLYFAAWLEVKTPGSPNLSPEQTTWMHHIKATGTAHYVVGPDALDNGVIDRILGYLAAGTTAAP